MLGFFPFLESLASSASSWSTSLALWSATRCGLDRVDDQPGAAERQGDEESDRGRDPDAHGQPRPPGPGLRVRVEGVTQSSSPPEPCPELSSSSPEPWPESSSPPPWPESSSSSRPASSPWSSTSSGLGVTTSTSSSPSSCPVAAPWSSPPRLVGELEADCRARGDVLGVLDHDRAAGRGLVRGGDQRPQHVRRDRQRDPDAQQQLPQNAHDKENPARSWVGSESPMRGLSSRASLQWPASRRGGPP